MTTSNPQTLDESEELESLKTTEQQFNPPAVLAKSHKKIDCRLSEWSNWSQCSVTCGNGVMEKTRIILEEPQNGGKPCLGNRLIKRRRCYGPPCN